MTISATTQGLRMGVATSSSRPTVPFDGQVISETDTDTLQVYKGTAWAPVSGLTLIKTQTIGTTVSSVAVTGVFSATYDTYKVVINGGVGSANQDLGVTLGSTATGYYYSYNTATYAGVASGGGIANGASFGNVGVFNTNVITMNFDLQNPFNAEETLISASRIDPSTSGSTGNVRGYLNNQTSYTDFTLTCASGTITGGTIYVYGYAKS